MWNVPCAICVPGLALEKSSATSDCLLAVDGGGIDGGLYGTSVVVGSWKLTAAPGAAALYGTACCDGIAPVSHQDACAGGVSFAALRLTFAKRCWCSLRCMGVRPSRGSGWSDGGGRATEAEGASEAEREGMGVGRTEVGRGFSSALRTFWISGSASGARVRAGSAEAVGR